jgi:hypothetical protein
VTNLMFDSGREGFLDGSITWVTPTIKASLCRSYTFSAAHKFVSDATGAGASLVSTATLGTKTVIAGVADSADSTFTAVAAGAALTSIIIYQASAVGGGADVAATLQRLICYIDAATNLPVTPNGGDIVVGWDNAVNKIFKL